VAEQCRHRLASLAYGRVDHEGIRCPYHGWKYDLRGQIEIVRKGGDPIGVIRDPAKNKIIEFDVVNEMIGLYRSAEQTLVPSS
jgi:phenylpropionate dioxygenase-like ring-hydroxylating dioxygenase large terminal subunit